MKKPRGVTGKEICICSVNTRVMSSASDLNGETYASFCGAQVSPFCFSGGSERRTRKTESAVEIT
jgi:hypothetical protein